MAAPIAAAAAKGIGGKEILGAVASNTSVGIDVQTDPTVTFQRLFNLFGTVQGIKNSKFQRELLSKQQEMVEAEFEENKRRYGLEYAMAQRNQKLNEFQQMFNMGVTREQVGQSRASLRSNLASASQDRLMREKQFQWMKEDRDKSKKANIAFSRGIAKGLLGKV